MHHLQRSLFTLAVLFIIPLLSASAQAPGLVSGRVMAGGEPATFATVYLKGTRHNVSPDDKGLYHLKAPAGHYTLVVKAVGYEPQEARIRITAGGRTKHNFMLRDKTHQLAEANVVAHDVSRVRKSAYNVVAVTTKDSENASKSLSDILQKLPGMKIRETGGVGSDMNMALDGFSGRHVKVFIDGVPQEGVGQTFSLNNIPVNFAERIEVYRGVVPVGFGTDAIGGVINVVTKRHQASRFIDAGYSYGAFNTHKTYVNAGQAFRNGFTYEINAFQNYSDNDYKVNTYVQNFSVGTDGKVTFAPLNTKQTYNLRRFNDAFHNESVIGKVGFTGRPWADRFFLGFNFSHLYKEIQTGVRQEIVYGEKHRRAHSLMPSLEYVKRDILGTGLSAVVTASYNHNLTTNIDTASRGYNWRGEWYPKTSRGEASYQYGESKNTNWNATLTLNYRLGDHHMLTFNHTFSDFRRTSRAYKGQSSNLTDYTIPKISRKHISGLSYRFTPSERWNVTAFGKYYRQYNKGPVSQSADGIGSYVNRHRTTSDWGYGAAATYYLLKPLQLKLSYERALRLPTVDELFGDEDLEAGKTDLNPEKSHNLNLNLSYVHTFARRHRLYAEGSLIYRDTRDYIKRGLDKFGGLEYGIYENHGKVRTKGYNLTLRYNYSHWLSTGATWNAVDTRDYEKKWTASSEQANVHYKVRLPNLPYRYANFDASLYWHDLFAKGNLLTLTYDGYWQHSFSLYWENVGDKRTKLRVPRQLSHNLSLTYALKGGRYNLSFECRNLTDARLYDNYSLQKAGRAFYGKVRIFLSK